MFIEKSSYGLWVMRKYLTFVLTKKMKKEILLEVIVNLFNTNLNDLQENIPRGAATTSCLVYNQHKRYITHQIKCKQPLEVPTSVFRHYLDLG